MKKSLLLATFAVLLTFSLTLTGCKTEPSTSGESKSESKTVSENSTEVSKETSLEESKPVVLEFDYDEYKNAYNKTAELKSLNYTQAMNMNMVMPGLTMDLSVDGNTKAIKDGKDSKVLSEISLGVLGTNNVTKSYYEDGYVYTDSYDMKYKSPITFDDFFSQSIDNELIKSDDIKNSSVEVVDGIKQYVLEIDSESFLENGSSDMLTQMLDSAVGSITVDQIDVDDIKLVITYNDGYISTTALSGKIAISGVGADNETPVSVEVTFTSTITLNNPGEDVTIETPTDLDEYIEIDTSDING